MIFFKVYEFISKNLKTANIPHKITSISMLILLMFLSGCAGFKPSPLNQAAWDNDVKQIKTLIDSGAFVDEVSPCPRKTFKVYAASPLDLAVLQGNFEAVKALLEAGADVNLSRYCHALTSSREIIIPNAPHGYYAFKGSALMLSSLIGNLQISKLLLESGADPNQLTEKGLWQSSDLNEFDALSFSAELGHSDITKLLLKYGADPNRRYKNGTMTAYRALQRGRIDYVITLLEEDALELESDPFLLHFNAELAELAHIAADYYAASNEKKAVLLYKQAIKFYTEAISLYAQKYKRWKKSADTGFVESYERVSGRLVKTTGKMVKDTSMYKLRLSEVSKVDNGLSLRQNIKESEILSAYDLSPNGPIYFSYIKYECEDEMYLFEYYKRKVTHSERSLNISKSILTCYEDNKPGIALIDCVKSASENIKL